MQGQNQPLLLELMLKIIPIEVDKILELNISKIDLISDTIQIIAGLKIVMIPNQLEILVMIPSQLESPVTIISQFEIPVMIPSQLESPVTIISQFEISITIPSQFERSDTILNHFKIPVTITNKLEIPITIPIEVGQMSRRKDKKCVLILTK